MSDTHAPHAPETSAHAPVSAQNAQEINKHIKGYIKIGVVQVVFSIVTVFISFAKFSSGAAQAIAVLLVAAANGSLVAAILMHLKDEKKTIWKVLIFTAVFFFVLFFLTYLARTDAIMGSSHNHH